MADKELKTVRENMASRKIFATPEDAANYLTKAGTDYADFAEIPLAAPGIDEEGNFDPEMFTGDTEVMVATLKNAGQTVNGKKVPGTVKAIVVAAVPKLEALLDSDAGRDWVRKIIYKELNHVAVRPLRDAEDISTVVDQMPTTIEGFITSGREGGAGILETFNELYKSINSTLASKVPVWAKARLIKSELKKAMESRGYALEFYPSLEDRGEGKDSLFVTAINLGITAAKRKGLDPTIFDRWLSTRNAKTYDATEDEDADDFDLESLTDSLMEDEAKEEAGASATDGEQAPATQPAE